MKFSTILLGVALYLLSPADAGISTNSPFNSITWKGGEGEKVVWVDDGKAPKLAQIGITSIDLMMGDASSQTFVANIGKVPATAKQINYEVPEDVGPPGSNYFIKYTAGDYTAFSGTFSIEDVNGKAPVPAPVPALVPAASKVPTDPNTPPNTTVPNAVPDAVPNAAAPNTVPNAAAPAPNAADSKAIDPKGPNLAPAETPKTTGSSSSASPTSSTTAQSNLPNPISSSVASNLFPSFSGVAAAAVAFAFTYLY